MYETEKLNDVNNKEELLKTLMYSFIKQATAAICGFFASCASFDGLAPFGVALSASIFPELIPACVLGCAAGYICIYGLTVLTLRYIAASAVGGIFAYLLKRSFKSKFHCYFSAVSGFFSVFVTGLILSISVTVSADEIVLYGAEAGAAGIVAWLFDKFVNISSGKKRASMLTGVDTTAVLTVFAILLLSLNSFPIYIFSLSVIVGSYAVLVSASYGGEKYGALTGICAGVILGFSQSASFVTGGVALGGLLTGIFGKKNRFISSVIFILSVAVTAFSASDGQTAAYIIYDVGISAIIFILTPKRLKKLYLQIFSFSDDTFNLYSQRKNLKMRLKTASDGMNEISSAVKAVGGIYRRRSLPKKEKIFEKVEESICKTCEKYNNCPKRNEYFDDVIGVLKTDKGENDKSDFYNYCIFPDKVISALSCENEKYKNTMRESAKTGETVNIVSDQFGSISDILSVMSFDIDEEEYLSDLSEITEKHIVNNLGYKCYSCALFSCVQGYVYCEISFPSNMRIDVQKTADSISELLNIKFEKPIIMRLGDGTINFTMCQKTKYRVENGAKQISSDGGKWCGDTFDSFYDGKGRFFMILSDGMGTGKKAAADSVMCCSLVTSLLRSGFPIDAILKVINSAMLVRSGEESLATLDIAVLNLYNGNVEFYKAGASFSVAMKHLKMLKIEKPSLPVGILREISFEKIELNLKNGDVFVLMSDGVPNEVVPVWREILKNAADYDGNELSDKLVKSAYMNSKKDSPDDITVMTAALLINE